MIHTYSRRTVVHHYVFPQSGTRSLVDYALKPRRLSMPSISRTSQIRCIMIDDGKWWMQICPTIADTSLSICCTCQVLSPGQLFRNKIVYGFTCKRWIQTLYICSYRCIPAWGSGQVNVIFMLCDVALNRCGTIKLPLTAQLTTVMASNFENWPPHLPSWWPRVGFSSNAYV